MEAHLMASLNLCQFIGNVGNIETRYTSSGKPVTNISLGVTKKWKDESGEKKEKTEWVKALLFGKNAENASQYVVKGQSLYISGEMATRKWTDKQNIERYSTEIIVSSFQMLGGKPADKEEKPASRPQQRQESKPDFDDDIIPF